MALENRRYANNNLIHHSDRGVQYCSGMYVEMLFQSEISISMTQNGNPYDNALAERMNGIIKSEFFPKRCYQNHNEAKKAIEKIITVYNSKRPHGSLDYMTPDMAHIMAGPMKKKWKQYKKQPSKLIIYE